MSFASEQLLDTLLEVLPVGLAVFDRSGLCRYANAPFEAFWARGAWAGRGLQEMAGPEGQGFLDWFRRPGTEPVLLDLTFPDQGLKEASVSARPVPGENGADWLLVTLEDQTAARRLKRHKQMAERILFHDLRNPVSGILSLTQLIELEAKDLPGAKEQAGRIAAYGEDMIRLMESLLDLTKIEDGRFRLVRAPIFLPLFWRDLGRRLQQKKSHRGYAWEVVVEGAPLTEEDYLVYNGKEPLLEQVFFRLSVWALDQYPRDNLSLRWELKSDADWLRVELQLQKPWLSDPGETFSPDESDFGNQGQRFWPYAAGRFLEVHGGSLRSLSVPGEPGRLEVSLPQQPEGLLE